MNSNNKPSRMDQHNRAIKCHVDTCYYYEHDYCNATNIEVNAMGDGTAKTSDGTCCTTFVNRNGQS